MEARNNFDAIRLFAAALVIYGHGFVLLAEGPVPSILGGEISAIAVKIFFSLSGYLIVASWLNDPNPKRFLARRLLRIWPALALVVFISACVLGPLVSRRDLVGYFSDGALLEYFRNLRLYIVYSLPGVFENNIYPVAVNGSLWSLPAEFAMYCLVMACGIMMAVLPRLRFAAIWGLATIIVLALSYTQFTLQFDIVTGIVIYGTRLDYTLDVAPCFVVGGCLYLLRRFVHASVPIGIGAILLCELCVRYLGAPHPLVAALIAYATISIGTASTVLLRSAGRFGDLSYGVYLYGFPVAQTLSHVYGRDLPFSLHLVATLLLSCAFAAVSFHLVEKQMLKFKPGRQVGPGPAEEIATSKAV